MPDYQDRMKDYVPVNERIAAFMEAWPKGSLQSEIVELTESRVTVKAYAYRTDDDTRPGTGHSSLNIPGSTPYTKGSEIENAETSAWGRAIAALGFEVKRGIASSEEIANKQPGRGASPSRDVGPVPAPVQYRRGELAALMREKNLDAAGLEEYATLAGIPKGSRATDEQMDTLIDMVRGHGTDEPLVLNIAQDVSAAPTPQNGAGDVVEASPEDTEPPKPGTPAYIALPAVEKAKARAYWSAA